jgi:hypothetical protein
VNEDLRVDATADSGWAVARKRIALSRLLILKRGEGGLMIFYESPQILPGRTENELTNVTEFVLFLS